MLIVAKGGTRGGCSATGCLVDLNGHCPAKLKVARVNGSRGSVALSGQLPTGHVLWLWICCPSATCDIVSRGQLPKGHALWCPAAAVLRLRRLYRGVLLARRSRSRSCIQIILDQFGAVKDQLILLDGVA